MSDYANFLRRLPFGNRAANFYDLYDSLYENSHGKKRYWLAQIPGFSHVKMAEDQAKRAQDEFDNTGRDPQYIDHYGRAGNGLVNATVGASFGVVRMARSLADVFAPEVEERCYRHLGHIQRRRRY